MEVRFQMVNSDSPNTIAVVKNEVDIIAFRQDPGWYEVTPEGPPEKAPEVQTGDKTPPVKRVKKVEK